ncbi:DNA invertase Pin-like site-specific DNA recombinase [Natrinema hispanicum]|uniref:DNA invertase Pin-like site-specific DNA recombinase n=1 Tax=Natrinema hispanicum TaxID=392421 RepID=A0A482YA00_9EURY|nr:recombinase family protein [Natrinema hispanicum]RZV10525.1 DNA invertase Pin-like site-specific DNA recombinase [Natrinema hispanicum]
MGETPDCRNVAAYVRVSTADQDAERQRDSIASKYEEDNITWFVDVESGASLARDQYNDLRDGLDEYDVVVSTEIDRLGRSFSELASFVEELRDRGIGLDLVEQPVDTTGKEDWMGDLMLNILITFADAERRMIKDRVQQGIDKARRDGKRVGRPPFGYDVEDGFMYQVPDEYARAQNFIREVKKGRSKRATAEFFEVPESAIQSILKRSEQNYEIAFDNDEWRIERAKVEAGEKNLEPLERGSNDF